MNILPPDKARQAYTVLALTLAIFFIGRATLKLASGEVTLLTWLLQCTFSLVVSGALYALGLYAIKKVHGRKGDQPGEH